MQSKCSRGYKSNYDFEIFSKYCASFYKQTYGGSGLHGSALSKSTMYTITQISNYEATNKLTSADVFNNHYNIGAGVWYVFRNKNYNTLWDMLTEYCEQSLYKFTNMNSIASSTMTNSNTLNVNSYVWDVKLTLNYEIVKEVSSQYLDDYGDNTSEFKSTNKRNKTDNNYTLSHLFTNKTFVPDEATIRKEERSTENLHYTNQSDNAKLLYFEATPLNNSSEALNRTNIYIKPHDDYIVDLGAGKSSTDYKSAVTQFEASNVTAYNRNQWENNNNAVFTAEILRDIFSDKYQTKLSFTMRIDDTLKTISGTDYLIAFRPELSDIILNLTNINSNLTAFYDTHIITKADIDLKTNTVQFEAISRAW
jgi:hypothetical protein